MKTYISQPGQNMHDICLNTYRSRDYLIKLCTDNGVTDASLIPEPGTVFTYDDTQSITRGSEYTYATANRPVGKFLLDIYRFSGAAYSMRKLSERYIGPAIRLRRSSDNAEKDIYFDVLGNFDTVTYTAFAGSDTIYAVIWYDQSGRNNNWHQFTADYQPEFNGKEIIFSSPGPTAGDCTYMELPCIFGNFFPKGEYLDWFWLLKLDAPLLSFTWALGYDTITSNDQGFAFAIGNQDAYANSLGIVPQPSPLQNVNPDYDVYVNHTKSDIYQFTVGNYPRITQYNVYNQVLDGLGSGGGNKFRIGIRTDVAPSSTYGTNFRTKEMVFYRRKLDGTRSSIVDNMNGYYGIF